MMSVKCDSFFNHLKNFKCNTCNFISDYAVFSKVVDVFYSTLRARITSKKDHQVLIDRVMNLGCKRISRAKNSKENIRKENHCLTK